MKAVSLLVVPLFIAQLLFCAAVHQSPEESRAELAKKAYYPCICNSYQQSIDRQLFPEDHPHHAEPLTRRNCLYKTATGAMRSGCTITNLCCALCTLAGPVFCLNICAYTGDISSAWHLSSAASAMTGKIAASTCPAATISSSCCMPVEHKNASTSCLANDIDARLLKWMSDPHNWPSSGEQEALLPHRHDQIREDIE